ncbi:bifunctional adenosylcobinamide kinase/adenosylcobinamide-phosphate guanylyltransferase [Microvirga flavescens]|uniref:bifunctional adenosylcobinamide kinase/adenosylcobinamide-phosphate guanylyltransferase n=1 Tax=Microvirga flavescens TaxID=2249811 RepID=UPI000DDA3381|nr:bifunctional adenosylcobinamide kinase/adenosylcobinamide-phosphate guanylyltransferase [Microvirga flavescens]
MASHSIAPSSRRVLVLGGARSGKSRIAQELAEKSGLELLYVATAQAWDDEMRERIAHHRTTRDERWSTHEEPLHLADALRLQTRASRVVLVDCLTLWLSNVMLAAHDLDAVLSDLEAAVTAASGPLILVSNEVGQGIVPDTELGRTFRDAQGRLNQRMAALCETVILAAAGCPLVIKPTPALNVPLA